MKLTTRVRQVFANQTVRKLVLGQAVVSAAFAGLFAFATSFFARFYFDDTDSIKNPAGEVVTVPGGFTDALKDAGWTDYVDSSAIGLAGLLVAGLSLPAITLGLFLATKIDQKFSASNPALRVTAATGALTAGAVVLFCFAAFNPIVVRFTFFLVFAALIIIAVSNLAAATADVIPARVRGSGFAVLQMCMAVGGAMGPLIIGIGSGRGRRRPALGLRAAGHPAAHRCRGAVDRSQDLPGGRAGGPRRGRRRRRSPDALIDRTTSTTQHARTVRSPGP